MSNKVPSFYTLTSPAIMMFPVLFEKKPYIKNGKEVSKPRFSAQFIIDADSPDVKGMKEVVASLARSKWPDKKFSDMKLPFQDGTKAADKRKAKDKDDAEWQRGKLIMNTKSYTDVRLCVLENGKIVDLESAAMIALHKDKFYQGVEVLAQFNFSAYDASAEDSKDGITTYLNMVLSLNKGTRRSGGRSSSEVFKGYVGTISAEDPTSGMDDIMGSM